MIPLSQAYQTVEQTLASRRLADKSIPLSQALGRTLAEDQKSRLDLPPFDRSAMDGYAVRADDDRDQYRLIETVPAGNVPTKPLLPGTTIKVMTGSAVPDGTARVIMLERTREDHGMVRILEQEKSSNVRRKGEDVRCGDVILRAPAVLAPLEIANLISAGITEVPVFRRPRLALIATGDEIVDSLEQLGPGKIMNSNGPMLAALSRQNRFEIVLDCVVPDQLEATVSTLRDALDKADIVVVSGGVSVGQFDFATAAMTELGLSVHFDRVAVKPGKPITFASSPQGVVFGLPGNPVSAYLMFQLFVVSSARLIMGGQFHRRKVSLPLSQSFARRKAKRVQFVPCRLKPDGTIVPVEFHGSAHLQALAEADGFFIVPPDVSKLDIGQRVDFLAFKGSPL